MVFRLIRLHKRFSKFVSEKELQTITSVDGVNFGKFYASELPCETLTRAIIYRLSGDKDATYREQFLDEIKRPKPTAVPSSFSSYYSQH